MNPLMNIVPPPPPDMAPVRTYLLAFNQFDAKINLASLERYLLDSVEILGYWNHLPYIFFVKSRLLATDIAARLNSFFPGSVFMLVEVNANNMNGIMPQPAWQWFYADHSVKRPSGWGANSLSSISFQP